MNIINKTGQQIAAEGWLKIPGTNVVPTVAEKYEGYPMAEEPMEQLAAVLDKESYEWLTANSADIADAVEGEVHKGVSPEAIRRFVLRHTGRYEIALRCEASARYLKRQAR